MPKKLLLLAALGLPQLSFAQTGPASSRFYVGVGANLLTDVPANSVGVPNLVGPSLTAGMQLAPQLALQISASYHWKHDSRTFPGYSSGSTPSYVMSDLRSKYLIVPVLLRYTFTEPAERFHFDGLAGLTILHGSSSQKYTSSGSFSSYYPYYPDDYSYSSTRACLTLGPAVRYSVTPNIELTANGLVSATLGNSYYRFSDRLFLNVLVGAHYTFGSL
jgi:hypothetical protein